MKNINLLLANLSKKQFDIDNYIFNKRGLDNKKTFSKRLIALFVEISEFINEVRSFKYWSNKTSSKRSILLEEYIDCMHFFLSIGNNINFDWMKYKFNLEIAKNNKDINILVIDSYINLSNFVVKNSKKLFKNFLDSFIAIGYNLDFSSEELMKGYDIKNKINYERQKNNY